jgi:MarR family transcriptional regulator, organic hydroperoxide resistance regulator
MAARQDLLAVLAPVTKALRRIEDDAAGSADLTMWQYAILSLVAETPGLNQGQVANTLGYSANRIIADLDLLQERRLLTRSPGTDRRANVLRTTAAGRRVMQRIQAEIRKGEDDLLAALPAGQRRALYSAAHSIAATLVSPDA